jgi:hypothetical protein
VARTEARAQLPPPRRAARRLNAAMAPFTTRHLYGGCADVDATSSSTCSALVGRRDVQVYGPYDFNGMPVAKTLRKQSAFEHLQSFLSVIEHLQSF